MKLIKRVIKNFRMDRLAQAAIEYMLLLGVVVAIVILAFPTFMPKVEDSTGLFFNKAAVGILGDPPPAAP